MVICLEQRADLHMAQLMPLPLTVSCFSKIQIGFTFLVPAHLGSPGKRAVKWVCVCVCVCVCSQGLQTLGASRRVSLNEAALSLAPPSGRYVVVSRRCTMIYVAANQFRDIVARENQVFHCQRNSALHTSITRHKTTFIVRVDHNMTSVLQIACMTTIDKLS